VTAANGYTNSVIRRTAGLRADRQWVIWQKGAQPGRASTLYYNTRRVGIDLKAIPATDGGMAVNESLLLGARNADGNQPIAQLTVTLVGGGAVPFDVDFKNGRIYVESQYEGQPVVVSYTAYSETGGAQPSRTTPTQVLSWIDESEAGQMVSLDRAVNEGQAYAFLDYFDGTAGQPDTRDSDPTLQPGRIWLFWTSPRGRTGNFYTGDPQPVQIPAAYDLYWQTFAPFFESPSYSGQ
jgi:hypothetical protein